MSFVQSKQYGDFAEQKICDIFSKIGPVAIKNEKCHDIYVDFMGGFKVEVKYDIKSGSTGNFAVEFYNPRSQKPSGINVSTAKFWVFYLNEKEIYMIDLDTLKKLCKNPYKTLDRVGDGNSSIHLLKKDNVQSCFTNLSNFSPENLKKIIQKKLTK